MNKKLSIISFICAIFLNLYPTKNTTAIPITDQAQISNEVIFNNSNDRSNSNSNQVILFIGLMSIGLLSWYLFQSRKGNISGSQALNHKSSTPLLDRVSPKLRRQLLRLINDPKTANRLLVGIQKNNGDRSPNWLAEKAIYDLRRGR